MFSIIVLIICFIALIKIGVGDYRELQNVKKNG